MLTEHRHTERQVPDSACESDACQLHRHVAAQHCSEMHPSFHLWEAGQTQCEQARPVITEAAACLLARNQFSMLKANKHTAPPEVRSPSSRQASADTRQTLSRALSPTSTTGKQLWAQEAKAGRSEFKASQGYIVRLRPT